MKYLILFFLPFAGYGQLFSGFEIVRADSVFVIDSTRWPGDNLHFGGISGLEMAGPNEFLLVSDRQAPSAADEHQYSWLFRLDTLGHVFSTERFGGVKNAEALRLHGGVTWYSFETEESTGIGYMEANGAPVTLAEHSMITSPFVALNRGIEGLAVGEDLWYSFEAGPDSTVMMRWPLKKKEREEVYTYPLDKNSCLSAGQPAGSSLGNGVSEILAIPGEQDKLLVLERCFNGRHTYIKVFEAQISGRTFGKTELFSWDPETRFNGRPLRPDNMEGITWGEAENGKRILYMISDDNHNTRHQRTILVKLREK